MKVLFLSAEVAPFSKTGGLGDVAAALPAALAAHGHQVDVVTPLYRSVRHRGRVVGPDLSLRFPFGEVEGLLREVKLGPLHRVLLLDAPSLFDRGSLYQAESGEPFPDNARRFGYLSIAALSAAEALGLQPDIVHLNDWQTGLAAPALKTGFRQRALGRAKVVFTIHNLAYQGTFPKQTMEDLGLPWSMFTPDGLEFYDSLSFMKAGLSYADALTTMSPTYAREIQTLEGGKGLDGVLRARQADLHGILNGVDDTEWNPETDPCLPVPFKASDLSGKALAKEALRQRFRLQGSPRAPLFGVVTRLTGQKGVDLLLQALPGVMDRGGEAVVLGSGEAPYEQAFEQLAKRFPGRLGLQLGFDPGLAHLIEGGSDFFLMPSLYEPCGLNQMYSLRYGTVPIVRATGGLEDTVVDLSLPDATGVKFQDYRPDAFLEAISRAFALYADPPRLQEVRVRGMGRDFSWSASAQTYARLYQTLTETR